MIGCCVSYAYVLILLIVGMRLEKVSKEISRKFVHIMTANWWFIVMLFFDKPFWPMVVGLSFVIVNIITYKYGLFTCIERDDKAKDKGTIYYAVTLVMLVILSYYYDDMFVGLIGSLIMGYADGLAALVGKKFNWIPYSIRGNKKSMSGSLTMFVMTLIIVCIIVKYASPDKLMMQKTLVISILATFLEAISIKGRDNLTVPMGSVGLYLLFFK